MSGGNGRSCCRPPVGQQFLKPGHGKESVMCSGWGIFDRNYGDFSAGIDKIIQLSGEKCRGGGGGRPPLSELQTTFLRQHAFLIRFHAKIAFRI